MANWSYNGEILPAFPTDWGAYTGKYTYRLIVWEEKRQRWFAMASSQPFIVETTTAGAILVFDPGGHGEYSLEPGETDWKYLDVDLSFKEYGLGIGGYWGYRMVWTNHDLINQTNRSVYMAVSDPVSPDSVITKLTPNVLQLRLNRGEVFQFAAAVEGTEVYSKRVNYSMSGNDAKGGTTLSRDGLLTIGATEHSSVFTVQIASRQDPTVVQTVTVTVVDYLSKLQMQIVSDLCDFNGNIFPAFPTDFGEYSDSYTYRIIVWEEKRQRWFAMASSGAFTVRKSAGSSAEIYAGPLHGQYYLPVRETAWIYVGNNYSSGKPLETTGEWAYRLVWANHDVMNVSDQTVYFPKSEMVRLCTPVTAGDETVYQVTGSTVWLDGTCVDLIETDAVYTVKTWLYRIVDGLNTTLPPTWTSEVFGGPTWSQRLSLSGLMPFTRYGIYAVICVDGVATDHHWQSTFTSMQTETEIGLAVEAEEVKQDGFTLSVTRGGLESATEYIAEVIVYHPDTSLVVFEGEMTFFGDGTTTCTVTGLEPNTSYAVSVDVYPAPAGAVVVRGDYRFTTAPEQAGWHIYTGVSGLARPVRAVYVGVNGRARRVKGVYLGVNGRAQPLRSK